MRLYPAMLPVAALVAGSISFADTEGPVDLSEGQFPVSITNAGAYRLTGNVTVKKASVHGIDVRCNGVTIDLGGFELSGPGDGSGCGIFQAEGLSHLIVSNGIVSNWRSGRDSADAEAGYGLLLEGSKGEIVGLTATACDRGIKLGPLGSVVDFTAYSNRVYGLYLGHGAMARGCTAYDTGLGITCEEDSTVTLCTSYDNAGPGFRADKGVDFAGCTSTRNSVGIECGADCDIMNGVANENRADGIVLGDRCSARESTANSNGRHGITLAGACESDRNTAYGNAEVGILVTGTANKITGCRTTDNKVGLAITGQGNTVQGHVAGNNREANYSVAKDNDLAPVRGYGESEKAADPLGNVDMGPASAPPAK